MIARKVKLDDGTIVRIQVSKYENSSSNSGSGKTGIVALSQAHCIILAVDLTNPATLETMDSWRDRIWLAGGGEVPLIVAGLKMNELLQVAAEDVKDDLEHPLVRLPLWCSSRRLACYNVNLIDRSTIRTLLKAATEAAIAYNLHL